MPSAVEFFSGIGAFAEASRDSAVSIAAAFDQNVAANRTYEYNFGLSPSRLNLDTIKPEQIPDADIWWMSPPCTPYSVRGQQRDLDDSRARSFLNLFDCLPSLRPKVIFIENVTGFVHSKARQHAGDVLSQLGYGIEETLLCATRFGVPMRRPRYFMVASFAKVELTEFEAQELAPLSQFICEDIAGELVITDAVMSRYGTGFDIVDSDTRAPLQCFTRNYARCMKASGSVVRSDDCVRRFSPREILNLLGFSAEYRIPREIPITTAWRLVGNSVDVRAIRYLLSCVLASQGLL